MNPQEKFQTRITETVKDAAKDGVHPAIVYMVLGGIQSDVLNSVRAANRIADEVQATEKIIQSGIKHETTPPVSNPDQRPGDN